MHVCRWEGHIGTWTEVETPCRGSLNFLANSLEGVVQKNPREVPWGYVFLHSYPKRVSQKFKGVDEVPLNPPPPSRVHLFSQIKQTLPMMKLNNWNTDSM
jgi:hypothetical protein